LLAGDADKRLALWRVSKCPEIDQQEERTEALMVCAIIVLVGGVGSWQLELQSEGRWGKTVELQLEPRPNRA